MLIRALDESDWPRVASIYAEGIATGNATFESEVPSWERWDAAHPSLRLVAVDHDGVVGWAALSPYSPRRCYRGVAEESVYVAEAARGRGVGRLLLDSLIARAEADGYWTLLAGIFPENEASVALHGACGFRVVGTHVGLGESDGVWRDVLSLERRSTTTSR
ncbi:MAG: N-acetyltransferase [Acidobacteriota bacterium]|nr:N-acetyltransferase [Acidobacteriota bacterium]